MCELPQPERQPAECEVTLPAVPKRAIKSSTSLTFQTVRPPIFRGCGNSPLLTPRAVGLKDGLEEVPGWAEL